MVETRSAAPVKISPADSYRYCSALAKRTGRNFYYSFLTLPRPMRRDMSVLYAFMRVTDDYGDNTEIPVAERRGLLAAWRAELDAAFDGEPVRHEVFPALVEVAERHQIPKDFLAEVIDGVESDLDPQDFETFADLERYCYRVAGVVGRSCIRIWGCHDPRADSAAVDCGVAFQVTNILRDIGEDADIDRCYVPLEDLRRFGVTREALRSHRYDEPFRELMQFECRRAWDYYQRARLLRQFLSTPGRRVFRAMLGIYGSLLAEIERRRFDVFSSRVRLSPARKLWIAVSACVKA